MRKISLQKNYFSISALITPRLSNWCWLSYYRCLKIFFHTAAIIINIISILLYECIYPVDLYWSFIFILLREFLVDFCCALWKSFVWRKVRCLWHFWPHQIENFCFFLFVWRKARKFVAKKQKLFFLSYLQ